MNIHRFPAAVLAIAMLAGCATAPTTYAPVIDTQTIVTDTDRSKYSQDLQDCQNYADQIDAARGAANGAVIGAIIGVGVGLLFGLRGQALAQVAGVGALSGGVNVAAEAGRTIMQIVQSCMSGRGYKVLT